MKEGKQIDRQLQGRAADCVRSVKRRPTYMDDTIMQNLFKNSKHKQHSSTETFIKLAAIYQAYIVWGEISVWVEVSLKYCWHI